MILVSVRPNWECSSWDGTGQEKKTLSLTSYAILFIAARLDQGGKDMHPTSVPRRESFAGTMRKPQEAIRNAER